MCPVPHDILIRFCFGKIGVIADIRQAFLNIEICEEDKNYLRFLYTDPEDDSKIQIYRSPFLLNASIKYHLNMLKPEEPPLAEKVQCAVIYAVTELSNGIISRIVTLKT